VIGSRFLNTRGEVMEASGLVKQSVLILYALKKDSGGREK